ncbi:hypothetical protein AAF712_011861 [Marasmius tenuissimus]|uniref:Glycoside hydrolase family 125 protein n=1 Tax=Marasmius tenuissimus TaxID=585030 RepID=A0ABR2ZK53_9AGAR
MKLVMLRSILTVRLGVRGYGDGLLNSPSPGGAFQPPPESGLPPSHNDWADKVLVNPPVNNQTVFECKYEIDSLCGFLKLSRSYYNSTKDDSFMNENSEPTHPHHPQGSTAIDQIFRVINEQSQGSFDDDFNFISYYNWTGTAGALSPRVNNRGNNEPRAYTGMVATSHRPSDDLATFAFLVPANAMLSVELGYLAEILDATGKAQNVSALAKEWSGRIKDAIWNSTLVDNVFAYETNGELLPSSPPSLVFCSLLMRVALGLGSRYVMDDANVPSLLSLPYLGFLDRQDPAYIATRNVLLSKKNPYYSKGDHFGGVGGPHVDPWHPWPMSQVSAIFGTEDDEEIMNSLYLIVNNTAGLGLIHESQNIYNATDYTRPWFAWANSYFAEMVLDLAERKPELILKDGERYVPGQGQ